jgi:hypothetical protein
MRKLIFVLFVGLLAGCGSSSGDSAPFTGTYSGTETGTQNGGNFSQTVTFILTQTGNSVTGTWSAGSGSSGTVSGTANGSSISTFTVKETDSTCPGTLTGSASINGSTFAVASLTGTITNCGAITASVSATKK